MRTECVVAQNRRVGAVVALRVVHLSSQVLKSFSLSWVNYWAMHGLLAGVMADMVLKLLCISYIC